MTKIKNTLILQEASEIKDFIEKNKKIPMSCKLADGTILSPYSVAYLMAFLIKDNFKSNSISFNPIVMYNTSSKYNDTINGEEVKKDDYLKMVNNFITYCNDHKRVPSYITTQKSRTKVSFELFMYGLSKIIVFHQANKYLPNYCTFTKGFVSNTKSTIQSAKKEVNTSTSNSKKTSTATKTVKNTVKKITKYVQTNLLENIGCKGRGQCTPYFCSCNALQQMFYRLTGILVPEKTIAAWAGVTTSGVGHAGIETAVAKFNKTYNKNLKITWKNFSDLGKTTNDRFLALGKLISKANTAIFFHLCYRLKYGHYEPIKSVNTSNNMLEILNSLGNKNTDGTYQGYIENRTFATQQSYISAMSQKSVCIITA